MEPAQPLPRRHAGTSPRREPRRDPGRALRILATYAALDPGAARAGGGGRCGDALGLEMRLRSSLRGEARRFEGLSCAELGALWAREGARFEGRTLLALLWVLARGRSPASAALEESVVLEVERRALDRLVSGRRPGGV